VPPISAFTPILRDHEVGVTLIEHLNQLVMKRSGLRVVRRVDGEPEQAAAMRKLPDDLVGKAELGHNLDSR
jgi:hypothetical protein